MQTHIQKAWTFLHGALIFLWRGVVELWRAAMNRKIVSIPLMVAIVAGIGAWFYFFGGTETTIGEAPKPEVTLLSIADLPSSAPITVIGEIRSVSEAAVAPDVSGRVVGVYQTLGSYVSAGAAIAEIENASQRAAVAQASAALARAKSGTTLSGITVENVFATAESSRQSAYAAIADSVKRKADAMFSNANGNQPLFNITTSNSQLKSTIETERLQMGSILLRLQSMQSKTLDEAALLIELATLEKELVSVRTFLSNLVLTLSSAIPSDSITQATVTTYQSDANAALSAITALQGTIANAGGNIKTAKENLTQGQTGASADILGAQAALDAANAALAKTIIRAPIAGTINSITLEKGNFVQAGVSVVRIVNTRGLEAIAYLSERDLPLVTVGTEAMLAGAVQGYVSRIAPALDPQTRKAEVRIALPSAAILVSGQSVSIQITTKRKPGDATITIPIAAVKITPDGAEVFSVSEGKLVRNPVILGRLSADTVEIKSGITLSSVIVADARGLKEGELVVVDKPI